MNVIITRYTTIFNLNCKSQWKCKRIQWYYDRHYTKGFKFFLLTTSCTFCDFGILILQIREFTYLIYIECVKNMYMSLCLLLCDCFVMKTCNEFYMLYFIIINLLVMISIIITIREHKIYFFYIKCCIIAIII